MSVIIFFSASKKFFFAEMMCKQLIFYVKVATRLTMYPKIPYLKLQAYH